MQFSGEGFGVGTRDAMKRAEWNFMRLSHAYDPAPFLPATGVLEQMYYSTRPFNEGLSSFEYPLYHATDEELDYFLGSLVHSARKALGGVTKAVGSVAKTAGKALSSVEKVI